MHPRHIRQSFLSIPPRLNLDFDFIMTLVKLRKVSIDFVMTGFSKVDENSSERANRLMV